MIVLFMSLILHAGEVPDTSNFCQLLLTPNQSSAEFLSQPWLVDLGESLLRDKSYAQKNYADQIRIVTDELVAQNRITPVQADTVFAEHLLGRYAPIFLKYTLAELVNREFDEIAITRFLQNFDRAYSPARQVEFAIAVTRRMLLTINDDPSLSNARGINQFVESARMFNLDEYDYGQFLQTWKFVRDSHVQTVVRFLLANILNTSRHLESSVQSRLAESLIKPVDIPSPWKLRLRRQSPKPAPTFDSLFVQALDLENISPSLIHVRGIVQSHNKVLFLDRFLNKSTHLPKTAKIYFADLEAQPPFARDQIFALDLADMNYALLRQVATSREFGALPEPTRTRARESLAAFDRLDPMVTQLRRLANSMHGQPLRVNEAHVAYFLSEFEASLKGRLTHSSDSTRQIANEAVNSVYNRFRLKHPNELTTADFLSIASGLINRVFTSGFLSPDFGLANGILGMSRDFDLTTEQIQSLIHLMDGFRAYRYRKGSTPVENVPINKYGEFKEVFDVSRWGRQPRMFAPALNSDNPKHSAEFSALLEDIQTFLSNHDDYRHDTTELLQLLSTSQYK